MVTEQEAKARLKGAVWLGDDAVKFIFATLGGKQNRIRAVGGVVRDTLLGRVAAKPEIDFATELTPDEVVKAARAAGLKTVPTGIEHGTVTLIVNGKPFEVTSLREDIETDGRHAIVQFGTDWTKDAERRDFTLNALYANADGTLFDPLNALEDCLSSHVRFIGNADTRIAEDRLRTYRFFRFSASHGDEHFDADGLAAAARAANALGQLSAERVGKEMLRMLALPKIAETLRQMAKIGILDLSAQTLAALAHYEQIEPRPQLMVRLALIMHEWGAKIQDIWRLSNADMRMAEDILEAAQLGGPQHVLELKYRFPIAGEYALGLLAALGTAKAEIYKAQREAFEAVHVPPFPVSGSDLLKSGFTSGPQIGEALNALEQAWIKSGFTLDKAALLQSLKV